MHSRVLKSTEDLKLAKISFLQKLELMQTLILNFELYLTRFKETMAKQIFEPPSIANIMMNFTQLKCV